MITSAILRLGSVTRKRCQALATAAKHEQKPVQTLDCTAASRALIVLHYSNGDEPTYQCLKERLEKYGQLTALLLATGSNYCYAAYADQSAAEAAYKELNSSNCVLPLAPRPHSVHATYTSLQPEDLSFHSKECSDAVPIPGLSLLKSFLTTDEEATLLDHLQLLSWTQLTNYRVCTLGIHSYAMEDIAPAPQWGKDLMRRVEKAAFSPFDHITIEEFRPENSLQPSIASHQRFGSTVATLSVSADIGLNMVKGPSTHRLWVPARSLLITKDEARYSWYTSISHQKADIHNCMTHFRRRRLALTFRKVTNQPCKCHFPEYCDSAVSYSVPTSEDIQRKYVRNTYDKIASHFSLTRYKPWPKVTEFLQRLSDGSIVLDVGCGNGKYLGVNPSCALIGTDISINLLSIASSRGFAVFHSDSGSLPVRSRACDAVLSIAVLHHFHTAEMRTAAVAELLRILRVGGQALIYVWAKEQSERCFLSQDCLVPWHLQESSGEPPALQYRYYHVFQQSELALLVASVAADGCRFRIDSEYYDRSNWCVVCSKHLTASL